MRLFSSSSGTPITIILVAPILFTIFAYPNTFSLSWNQGRGGFLFAMAFIAAELIGINQKISRKKFFLVIALAALTIGYFIALSLGLRDAIVAAGQYYKVQIIDSWIWMWDFIVMAIYVSCSLVILFGKRWYKFASAGAIYLAGSAIILSINDLKISDTKEAISELNKVINSLDEQEQGVLMIKGILPSTARLATKATFL